MAHQHRAHGAVGMRVVYPEPPLTGQLPERSAAPIAADLSRPVTPEQVGDAVERLVGRTPGE